MITVLFQEADSPMWWEWQYPGDVVQLIKDWRQGLHPRWEGCCHYAGELVCLRGARALRDARERARASGCVWTTERTFLVVDGITYPAPTLASIALRQGLY